MARDCTEPRNMANVQCRNCDEFGHMNKECPKPRDSKFCCLLPDDRMLTAPSVARQVQQLPGDGSLQVQVP